METENKQPSELDSILKEISSFDAPKAEAKSVDTPAAPARKASAKPERGIPVEQKILAGMRASAEKKAEEKRAAEEAQAIAVQQAALHGETPEASPATPAKKTAAKPAAKTAAVKAEQHQGASAPEQAEQKPRLSKTEKKTRVPKAPKTPKMPKTPKEAKPVRNMPQVLVALLVVVSIVSMLWLGVSVHPDTGTATSSATEKKLNMMDKMSVALNNAASDALGNLTYIKKLYTIPETDLVAPAPDQAKFGSTDDPQVVQAIVDQAADLLDGQKLAWNADIDFWEGEPIQYYYDETILAITWKEIINGNMCTFGEVKIAHGSQLRRALAGNEYGSSVEEYPSDMAAKANAVLAISGDFYGFRSYGITVYQRTLYRHETKNIDTCYFTGSGDMVFSRKGELSDKSEAQQFIEDNDVIFSAAFGPILVENGEKVAISSSYPIGEVNKRYSRTAIGQMDELHYLMMTVNFEGPCQVTCTLDQAADYIYSKGVKKAYALDGGQTSTMIFNDELVNRVDWNAERTMSDIIYFATAVPEGGSAE